MLAVMEVLGGVLVLGGVTTTDMPATKAESKVNPGVTHFQTFFAAFSAGSYFLYGVEMGASCLGCCHCRLRMGLCAPN